MAKKTNTAPVVGQETDPVIPVELDFGKILIFASKRLPEIEKRVGELTTEIKQLLTEKEYLSRLTPDKKGVVPTPVVEPVVTPVVVPVTPTPVVEPVEKDSLFSNTVGYIKNGFVYLILFIIIFFASMGYLKKDNENKTEKIEQMLNNIDEKVSLMEKGNGIDISVPNVKNADTDTRTLDFTPSEFVDDNSQGIGIF